jgi:hypothetical protein
MVLEALSTRTYPSPVVVVVPPSVSVTGLMLAAAPVRRSVWFELEVREIDWSKIGVEEFTGTA